MAAVRAADAPAENLALRLVVLVLFTLQLAAMIAVIPPWQNPDEPQHVMFASVLAKYGPSMLPDAFDDDIEADIVRSMRRHQWWLLYQRPALTPIPLTFTGIEGVDVATIHGPALYYVAVGALLKRLPTNDATTRLYLLRLISAMLAVATLWCIWTGTQQFVGFGAALIIATMVALHPQFAIVSTTAGPDAGANLAGSVVWWQAGRLWAGKSVSTALVVMWMSAFIAAATARVAAPLLLIAAVLTLWTAFRAMTSRAWFVVCRVMLAVAAGVMALALLNPSVMRSAQRVALYAATPVQQAFVSGAHMVDPWDWLAGFYGSFWLTAGWMRYRAPEPLLTAVAIVAVVALFGLVRIWVQHPAMRGRIALASLFCLVQLSAVVVTFYFNSIGAQGRYMFPVLAPSFMLLWIGLQSAWPAGSRRFLGPLVIAMAFCANLAGWHAVLFPTFLSHL